MLRQKLLNRLCFYVVFLAVLNKVASIFSWYTLMWWFDMPMHLLGGLTVFFFSAIVWLPARKWVSNGRFLFESIITTVLIGVLWEGLELYLYIHYGSPDFITLDSLSDVLFDLTGAFLGAFISIPFLAQFPYQAKTNTDVVS